MEYIFILLKMFMIILELKKLNDYIISIMNYLNIFYAMISITRLYHLPFLVF